MKFGSLAAIVAGLLSLGCASRGNIDLLEAKMRRQEDELRTLHAQVEQTRAELVAARRLNESLQQRLVQHAGHEETFDLSELHFRVTSLKINPLLTGGFNRDGEPGDDQITLVVTPYDNHEKPVRLPGTVAVELLDPAQPADQQSLGNWTFDAKQTATAWQSILGTSAFRFELPWQTRPQAEDLELRVRFHTSHGDRFEASSPVKISLP
jgi:outer membrane murein-binding lipoprotein Lpp